MGEADIDFEDEQDQDSSDLDSEDDDDERVARARVSDLPEEDRPVALTAFEIFRVFIVTRAAFPDPVQRATYRQEAWNRAWKIHDRAGDPPPITALIRRLVSNTSLHQQIYTHSNTKYPA